MDYQCSQALTGISIPGFIVLTENGNTPFCPRLKYKCLYLVWGVGLAGSEAAGAIAAVQAEMESCWQKAVVPC